MRDEAKSGSEYLDLYLERFPLLVYYVRSKGWSFILSYVHRVTGVLLTLYLMLHVYTLSTLSTPAVFTAKMNFFNNILFSLLEWAIAIPLIFHALNGGRLILFELFHIRDNDSMIRWVVILSAFFVSALGLIMLLGNQEVSAVFLWLFALIWGAIAAYLVFKKTWTTRNQILWKLQRISGAFLLPMLCAHMLFLHVNYRAGHDVLVIAQRMQSLFMKAIDFTLIVLVVFHSAYGLCSILSDYIEQVHLRRLVTAVIVAIMAGFGLIGVRLLASV